MTLKQMTEPTALPLRGGCNTAIEKSQIPFGGFSMLQNVRGTHPGFKKRAGQRKLHDIADGANKVMSMYQFVKTRVDENHFFIQMSDNDILEYDNDLPTTTTGVFGSSIYTGSSNQIPATWSRIGDKMLFSDGVDQHQIYAGDSSYIEKFIVYKGSGTIPDVVTQGEDYSDEVSDGDSSTVAVLDSLSTLANYDCIFIQTPTPVKSFTFTVSAANGTASVLQAKYWNGSWTSVSNLSDGTSGGGASMAQTGTVTFDAQTDSLPKYLYGISGYWYQLSLSSGAMDAEVEISGVTYEGDWFSLVNMWDGVPQFAVEVQVNDTTASGSPFKRYGATAVTLDDITAGDEIFISSPDPIEGFYIDPGYQTNEQSSAVTVDAVYGWDGDSWVSVGTVNDGSEGASRPGWVTFPRMTGVQPFQFQTSAYYAYWYKFTFDGDMSDDVVISIQTMPYFDIEDFGKGYCNCTWKDRSVTSYNKWGEYIYISQAGSPMVMNGTDFGILEVGDGRSNKITAMRRFHNELMVWQEERGVEGGCLTLIEGYSPTNFGKLVLSSRLGTFSNKSVEVLDGILTSTKTDERIKTLAFFLSRYGICVTDGRTVSVISDEIRNYFDPTKDECIRRGYEKEHWLSYDSVDNVLRIGLVSGSTATRPNIFPVYDLTDKAWSFDELGQELSCMIQCEATTGNAPVLQFGGGADDGTVYQLNYGGNDSGEKINSYADMEFNGSGKYMLLREMILMTKAEIGGEVGIKVEANGKERFNRYFDLDTGVSDEILNRHRISTNIVDQHFTVQFKNEEINKTMTLQNFGIKIFEWVDR